MTMLLRTLFLMFAFACSAWAQDYPSRPIHIVVPYPAGGIADKVAREVGDGLSKRLNQPVVVENKAGAAGNIGFDFVARQPADGYTILLAPASNLTIQPLLFKNLTYDLDRDFAPLSLLIVTPQVLLVNPGVPVHNVKELVEYSKSHPKTVNFGITKGAYMHLAGELLKSQGNADFTAIPYQGTAPALNAMLGGQVQFVFNEVTTALPQVQGGKARALAIAYKSRAPLMPDVPTMAEAGFPGIEVTSWYAMVVKSGTPKPVVDMLAREIHAIMQSPEMKKRYEPNGAFTVGSTPEELGALIRSEKERWTPVVKQAGIEPN
ncbi:MAG TPA: tripartite tricarboxylate transporter substrate binding protein [Ramlibacter sp.]